ncbi:sugar transferase [Polynucleobacter paneuropaeus]|nr:sugar transferase [Polynucleobacter paneuropaeus]
MKRLLDLFLALLVLTIFWAPILFVAILVLCTSRGPILYWSCRVGRYGETYQMPKFRSMRENTPEVASHLLNNPEDYLTPIGSLLRKSSLDELPQLWCILIGEMSFVGPRPALFNQFDLISQRKKLGIDNLLPGLTGWAQVNGRDELNVADKVDFDLEYLNRQSILFDFKILLLTFFKVLNKDGVSH